MNFRLNCLIIVLIMFTIYVTISEESDIKWIKSGHTGNTQIHYFYNDNNYVVTSGSEKTIKITNMKNDSIIFKASLNDIIINARVTEDDTQIIVLTSIADRLLPSVLTYDIKSAEKLDSVYIKNVNEFAQVGLSNDSKVVSYIDYHDKVMLFDVETGEYLAMFDSSSILDTYSFEFSPNNEHIGIVYDKAVKIYNYKTMQLFKEINITSKILSKIAFNNDGSKMIVYDPDGNVTIIDCKTGELIDTKKFPEKSIRQVLFTNDTLNLMVIGTNSKINIWNYKDNSIIKILSTNLIVTGDCQYDFDKNTLYICAKNGITAAWDIENDKLGKYITKNNSFAFYCNNGKYIASYLNHILNSETGKLLYEIGNNAFPIKYSNKYYYTKDSIVYFGDYNNNQIIDSVNLHKRVRLFGFSDDGKYCSYSTHEDYSRFYIMNWDSKQVLYSDSIRVMKYSSDGKWAACRHSERNQILFVNLFEKKLIHIFETKYPTVSGFCFSADNKYFFINQLDSNIKMFDLNDLSLVKEFKTGTNPNSYSALAVTSDSKYLIEGSLQGEVRIWDIESGIIKHQYEKFNAKFETLDISPDSKYILAGYKDGTAILFNSRFGTTSVNDNININFPDFRITPNPTKGKFSVDLANNELHSGAKFIVSDITGNTLFTLPIKETISTIDLTKHPNGIYFLTVLINEQSETFKIMKIE